MRCAVEVGPQRRVLERGQFEAVDRCTHVVKPPVPGIRVDLEGHMPHAQSRVAPLLAVGSGAAPVLFQEHPQAALGSVHYI